MKIWRNLFWKEWHEQKWKLLALTAIAVSVCVALLFQDLGNVAFSLFFTNLTYAMLAPILMGMGVCASEHASGVIQFVRAQPISIRRVATVRWIAGACVLLIPLLSVNAICWIVMCFEDQVGPQSVRTDGAFTLLPGWGETFTLFFLAIAGMAACLNLYAWILAVAVNQRTEFRAGLIGLIVTVAMVFVGIGGLSSWHTDSTNGSVLSLFCVLSSPLVSLGITNFIRIGMPWLVVLAVVWQVLLTMCLMQMSVFRYGREERWLNGDLFRRTKARATATMQLGRPRSSQWWALLWLEIRQSLPVCVVGLCLVPAIVLMSGGFTPDSFDSLYPTVGCVLALLIGVGTFVSELQQGLYTFWRSRPISPLSWFWFKFIGGAIALVWLFDVPCITLAWSGIVRTSSPGLAAFFPMLLHLLCYSFAVFAACSVRHSSYSTVFAVSALLVVILIPELSYVHLPRFFSFFALWQDTVQAVQSLAIGYSMRGDGQEFWHISMLAVHCLLPASILIGAIAIPTTIAAAYLVKRDLSIGS